MQELRARYPDVQVLFPRQAEKSDIVQVRGPKEQVEGCAGALRKIYKELVSGVWVSLCASPCTTCIHSTFVPVYVNNHHLLDTWSSLLPMCYQSFHCIVHLVTINDTSAQISCKRSYHLCLPASHFSSHYD